MTAEERYQAYITQVQEGQIPVNKYVRWAIDRQLVDLSRQGDADFPYIWDPEKGARVVKFIEMLKHSTGTYAGMPFILSAWQVFLVMVLFSWIHAERGVRRFRRAYTEVARKNGKSALASALALYMFLADGEMGSQVYAIATKEDQAKIVWKESVKQVEKSELTKYVKKTHKALYVQAKNSQYMALGRDSNTQDGLSPYFVVADEYHAHKDNEMVNVMVSGMGYRTQPLLFIITTAGSNLNGPCYAERTRIVETLQSAKNENWEMVDETTFALIYTLDDEDDFTDPEVWEKANPNLAIIAPDFLPNRVKEAKSNPRVANDVKTKNLNIWVHTDTEWIGPELWGENDSETVDLRGRTAFAGIDLSRVSDFTAYVLCFPPVEEDPIWRFLYRFFLPEEGIIEKEQQDKVPYTVWAEQGYITLVEGPVIDEDAVLLSIDHDVQDYDIREYAYDPAMAKKLNYELEERGFETLEFRQNMANISPGTKEFEKLAAQKLIGHGGNPVIAWMVSNTAVKEDEYSNIKPVKVDKAGRRKKIDGVVASIMALDRAIYANGQVEDPWAEIIDGGSMLLM